MSDHNKYNNFHGTWEAPGDRYKSGVAGFQRQSPPPPQPIVKKSRSSGGADFPWWVVLIGFMISPLLGFGLLALEYMTNGGFKSSKKQVNYVDVTYREYKEPKEETTAPNYVRKPTAQERNRARGDLKSFLRKNKTWLMLAVGVILTMSGINGIVDALYWMLKYEVYSSDVYSLINGILKVGAGIGLFVGSIKSRANARARVRLLAIVGDKPVMSIREIASAAGMDYKKCKKQLQRLADDGLFGEHAYLDMSSGMLITGRATAEQRAAIQEDEPTKEEAEQAESRYQSILDKLEALDRAIPGEQMSNKIRRLSGVSAKIFKLVEEDPRKLPQLRKFMDYYLPTSLKLLTAYSQLDAQGVEGENITESKNKIEAAMDSLVTAFQNQLDKLFAEDALDISSDITVMENMLRADGLSDESDFFAT